MPCPTTTSSAGINSASVGEAITQPGSADGGTDPADRIGTLYAYQTINFSAGSTNTIDAAIALVSTANVGTATPDDGYGTPSTVTAQAFPGLAVQKYGRTTGFQQGTVAATNVSVDVCYLLLFNTCFQQARFVNQISISPGTFSAAGDSGSLIVTQSGNQPVALLFAGGDGLTIGNPIDTVLQRFGVMIEGAAPGNGPPGAPSGLSVVAGDGQLALSWNAPAFGGGSAITNSPGQPGAPRRAVRASSPTQAPPGASWTAPSRTARPTTTRSRPRTATARAPPRARRAAPPLPRRRPSSRYPRSTPSTAPNESPLSDAGRWANLASGAATTLAVNNNQLACTLSTTCSAWRNPTTYGPDTEVWARITTLPGTTNQLRLYARLQQPSGANWDGYMLRTNQLAGPDELYLERIDNGNVVSLLTMSQELAAGDTLLLRTK